MATFSDWLGSRALTPVEPEWLQAGSFISDDVVSYFAPYTMTAGAAPPYEVTQTRTRVDYFGNIVADTSPVTSYNTGPYFNYLQDRVSPNNAGLFLSAATTGAASGTSDLDVQRYDSAGNAVGSVTTLLSGIAGFRQLRDGDAATYGTKYFLAYSTFDASTSSEQIKLLAYNADNSPLTSEDSTLDAFTTGNGYYDSFAFGTLMDSSTASPSYIYLIGYQEGGSFGVAYQPVSTSGVREGTQLFVDPLYPAGSTDRDIGNWTFTRLSPGAAGSLDLAIAMPFSDTLNGTTSYGLDVRLLDTMTNTAVDDTIALVQQSDTRVVLASLPGGGLVVGYTDDGTAFLREYSNTGAVVGGSSFALPAGVSDFNISSIGDGRILLEYPQAETGGNQLYYDIYDTRQAGITVSTSGEAVPSPIAGTVYDDVFYVSGAVGADTIVGAGGTDFVVTTQADGSGTVLADLKDGYVAKGDQVDAILYGIQGVQLGADPSAVLGLTSGTDLLYGGSGADQFYNEGATDYISGGSGSNAVVGGSGTSIFYGTGGADTMYGGTGQNFMQAGPTAASQDVFYGNGGIDFVYGGPGATDVIGGSGTEDLTGGSGFSQLVGSNQSAGALNVLNGGAGTDVFYAGVGTNLLYEVTGTDVLAGNAGADYIYGGAGRSFIYGGSGKDVVTTGAGDQYVKAGSGLTFFNDTAANLTAGRFDQIDNFSGGQGTNLYLPSAVQGQTSFVQEGGGTAVLTAVNGGTAELFASGANASTVQANTHFTL